MSNNCGRTLARAGSHRMVTRSQERLRQEQQAAAEAAAAEAEAAAEADAAAAELEAAAAAAAAKKKWTMIVGGFILIGLLVAVAIPVAVVLSSEELVAWPSTWHEIIEGVMDFFYKLIEKLPGPGDNDKGELLGTAPKQARENCKENNVGFEKRLGGDRQPGTTMRQTKGDGVGMQKEMELVCTASNRGP